MGGDTSILCSRGRSQVYVVFIDIDDKGGAQKGRMPIIYLALWLSCLGLGHCLLAFLPAARLTVFIVADEDFQGLREPMSSNGISLDCLFKFGTFVRKIVNIRTS